MPSPDNLTPTMRRILDLLSDGRPHSRQEIGECLYTDNVDPKVIRTNISNIRKVLRPKGQDILCHFVNFKTHYQHVRLLKADN